MTTGLWCEVTHSVFNTLIKSWQEDKSTIAVEKADFGETKQYTRDQLQKMKEDRERYN